MNEELETIVLPFPGEPEVMTTEAKVDACYTMLTELMVWKAEMDEVLSGIIEQFSGGGIMSLMGGLFGKR